MARRLKKTLWSRSFESTIKAMTRSAIRAGTKAIKDSLRNPAVTGQISRSRKASPASANWTSGIAIGPAGPRRYRLYKPTGIRRSEHPPLLVMLHGCGQDAEALAAASRMNQIAARERFLVLYPEQDRLANMQGCWNWYDTRTGNAQSEAATINAAIEKICLAHAVDRRRIAVAGISAGGGIAALLAISHPEKFRAIAMHSGVAPGAAYSSASAIRAMLGRSANRLPLPLMRPGTQAPSLLVIHGSSDPMVVASNGDDAARRWGARMGAKPGTPRIVQRGARYPATITDYRSKGRLIARHCEIERLGHAWSGGAAGHPYSDPKGPDASRMIWSFVAKQFADVDG